MWPASISTHPRRLRSDLRWTWWRWMQNVALFPQIRSNNITQQLQSWHKHEQMCKVFCTRQTHHENIGLHRGRSRSSVEICNPTTPLCLSPSHVCTRLTHRWSKQTNSHGSDLGCYQWLSLREPAMKSGPQPAVPSRPSSPGLLPHIIFVHEENSKDVWEEAPTRKKKQKWFEDILISIKGRRTVGYDQQTHLKRILTTSTGGSEWFVINIWQQHPQPSQAEESSLLHTYILKWSINWKWSEGWKGHLSIDGDRKERELMLGGQSQWI